MQHCSSHRYNAKIASSYKEACLISDGEEWDGGGSGSDEPIKHGGVLIASSQQYSRVAIRSLEVDTSSRPQQHVRDVRVAVQGCRM